MTDDVDPRLVILSASDGGLVAGQQITWDPTTTAGLAQVDAMGTVVVSLWSGEHRPLHEFTWLSSSAVRQSPHVARGELSV